MSWNFKTRWPRVANLITHTHTKKKMSFTITHEIYYDSYNKFNMNNIQNLIFKNFRLLTFEIQ